MTFRRLGRIAGLLGAVAWACGDGGAARETQGAAGGDGRSALVRLREEPSGGHCPEGGTALEAGLDQDGDGALGDAEVTTTTYVCDGAHGNDGAKALVDLEDEPPGAHCADGGTAVRTGVDQDGDGALDDSEVTDSRYLCNEPSGEGSTLCPGGIVEGSYTLENSIDAALLAGCTRITGDLTVIAPGLTTLALPLLVTVGGSVVVSGSAALTTLALPLLATVGGSVVLSGSAALTTLELPLLATAACLRVYDNSALSLLALPALHTLGYCDVADAFTGSARTSESVEIRENHALTSFVAPLLATVGGGVHISWNDALTSFGMPLLAKASCLRVDGNPALSLLTLPALQALDYCSVDWGFTFHDGLGISGNVALTSFAMPLLASIGGPLVIQDNPELPECPIWSGFFGKLLPSGVSGSITIAGNKDDGPC